MAVYVDDVRHRFGNMVMCHLWADTLDELLEMVDRIGVQRKWIQGHPELSFGKHLHASWVHFDIALSKKDLALKAGAILTDKYGPSEHTAKMRATSHIPEVAERGKRMLANIAKGLHPAALNSLGEKRISDSDAVEIWRAIEVLTDDEGSTVMVLCPNPDFNGQPNFAIECNGAWTGWNDRRFAADLQVDCFRLAVRRYLEENPDA